MEKDNFLFTDSGINTYSTVTVYNQTDGDFGLIIPKGLANYDMHILYVKIQEELYNWGYNITYEIEGNMKSISLSMIVYDFDNQEIGHWEFFCNDIYSPYDYYYLEPKHHTIEQQYCSEFCDYVLPAIQKVIENS